MADIANNEAVQALWLDPIGGIAARIEAARQRIGAHPSRTVVLLPYAQLLPLAQSMWARALPGGTFLPRFSTTSSWARQLAPLAPPSPQSLSFDPARDGLTALALLEAAGLASHAPVLAPRLVQAAHEVAQVVAATAPSERAAWAQRARAAVRFGVDASALRYEAAVAEIALEWALASDHAVDRIWHALESANAIDALIVLEGLNPDPLADALKARIGARAESIALLSAPQDKRSPPAAVHAARDAEDEAERAAACVLRHLAAGRATVALIATDRVLARRVRALLASRGVSIQDESGWALSTTRAASHLMGALRAAAWDASCDAVLDWIKNAPAFAPAAVRKLEKALRRNGVGRWQRWCALCGAPGASDNIDSVALALTELAERRRAALQQPRPLVQWVAALRTLLEGTGQWNRLADDSAGQQVLQTLKLDEDAQAALVESLADTVWASRRVTLADFTAWASNGLEGERFAPEPGGDAQVAILPLAQLFARPFAALVLPGCDEKHLPAAPEPGTGWSAVQREALGLVTREQLAESQRAAWQGALTAPHVDLLWHGIDEGGEPILPSPLLQQLALAGGTAPADDPRSSRNVTAAPTRPSQPRAPQLAPTQLSASAYESLRRCPYQFFALKQLRLSESDEIDVEVGKRDFGIWLHRTLKIFHDELKEPNALVQQTRVAIIDVAAQRATRDLGLADDEFLPFAAAWPKVREGYLAWLDAHESDGAVYVAGEADRELKIGALSLIGRIDRIDRRRDGSALLIDYKTENPETTKERIRNAAEDTQLAFYGALLEDDTLSAMYLNVGEKKTSSHEQKDVVELRDVLIEGILSDTTRIAAGAALPPLGEGSACEWCAARGLCRKDFW